MTIIEKREKIETAIDDFIRGGIYSKQIHDGLENDIDEFQRYAIQDKGQLPPLADRWGEDMKKKLNDFASKKDT